MRGLLQRLLGRARPSHRPATRPAPRRAPRQGNPPSGSGAGSAQPARDYPGDYTGTPRLSYSPSPDGQPDPGEIVWTWVPYEEDHRQGKDRPVLVVGRDGPWLLGLMLTSKDHDRDAADEARWGRHWVDIGVGDWDRQRRPSEVRVDRVLRVDPAGVRREGAVLDRSRFQQVADAVRDAHR
ncbi:MAG TPA: type II toxin-antitoxin system PemK/MazF family toxin [Pedococcus sp.]|nr:type II toxin-antitoxin system PemK/MazF family toxin [Pedococcus sp.]